MVKRKKPCGWGRKEAGRTFAIRHNPIAIGFSGMCSLAKQSFHFSKQSSFLLKGIMVNRQINTHQFL
jgi:hypothetical protein